MSYDPVAPQLGQLHRFIVSSQVTRSYDAALEYQRDSGRTTTWTGTFDQLENVDTDPVVITALFGMDYDPKRNTRSTHRTQAALCAGATYFGRGDYVCMLSRSATSRRSDAFRSIEPSIDRRVMSVHVCTPAELVCRHKTVSSSPAKRAHA